MYTSSTNNMETGSKRPNITGTKIKEVKGVYPVQNYAIGSILWNAVTIFVKNIDFTAEAEVSLCNFLLFQNTLQVYVYAIFTKIKSHYTFYINCLNGIKLRSTFADICAYPKMTPILPRARALQCDSNISQRFSTKNCVLAWKEEIYTGHCFFGKINWAWAKKGKQIWS